jgi:hypothetical protein
MYHTTKLDRTSPGAGLLLLKSQQQQQQQQLALPCRRPDAGWRVKR